MSLLFNIFAIALFLILQIVEGPQIFVDCFVLRYNRISHSLIRLYRITKMTKQKQITTT